jgi:hypothetical protein
MPTGKGAWSGPSLGSPRVGHRPRTSRTVTISPHHARPLRAPRTGSEITESGAGYRSQKECSSIDASRITTSPTRYPLLTDSYVTAAPILRDAQRAIEGPLMRAWRVDRPGEPSEVLHLAGRCIRRWLQPGRARCDPFRTVEPRLLGPTAERGHHAVSVRRPPFGSAATRGSLGHRQDGHGAMTMGQFSEFGVRSPQTRESECARSLAPSL